MKCFKMLFIAAAAMMLVSPAHALDINFIYDTADPVLSDPDARAAAEAAAMSWINRLEDDVTVNIELKSVDFGGVDANGRTSFSYNPLVFGFDIMRNAMISDENAESDVNTIVGKLPASNQFSADTPSPLTTGTLTTWTVGDEIGATSANFKALGSTFDPTWIDATIEFNMDRNWDFDRNDGVPVGDPGPPPVPGQYDFQTTIAHEIAHALGYQSMIDPWNEWVNVDKAEYLSDEANSPWPDPYNYIIPSALDMFRFGGDSLATAFTDSEFTNTARNLNPFVDFAYLILTDNWLNAEWEAYEMATGQFMGDGRQASHWKNQPSGFEIGIMDAVMPAGLGPDIMDPDLWALDVIGWNLVAQSSVGGVLWNGEPSGGPEPVPEPATILLFGTGLIGLASTQLRKKFKK